MKKNINFKLMSLFLITVLIVTNLFATDLEADKKKLERELEGRISNEIRKYFSDLKYLVTAEITFAEESAPQSEEQTDTRDIGLPGVQGFESSRTDATGIVTVKKQTIENVLIKLLIEKNRAKEDKELLESIAFYTAKLDNGRGDRVEIQEMVFPEAKNISTKEDQQSSEALKKIAELEQEKKIIEEQIRVESVKRIEELEKTNKETQEKLSVEQQTKLDEYKKNIEELSTQLTETKSKIEEERIKLQQQQQEARETFDPLIKWFLIIFLGLVIALLLINMFLTRLKNAQPKVEYLPQQGTEVQALTDGVQVKKGQSFEESVQEMSEGFELEKMRSKLVSACAGESNIASTVIKEMMLDSTQKDKLAIVTEQLGGSMLKVMKDYFTIDEVKKIQEITLEPLNKTADDKKQALQYFETQILVKRFAESRNKTQNPFVFLERLTESQLYMLMKEETPGIIAIILSQLSTPVASQMLKNLPSMQQGEVALELGKLTRMDAETYKSVAGQLATKASEIPVINNVQVQGSDMLLDIFDNLDEQSEETITDFIKTINLDLYREISSQRVAFQAIGKLDDRLLRQLARDVSGEELSTALKNAPPELAERIFSLLPAKARTLLEDRMATLKSVAPEDELKARRRITRMIRTYVKSGIGTLAAVQQEAQTVAESAVDEQTATEGETEKK
ncbi:MAG: hypothetical protein EXR24_00355 [Ignavibacteria bacterium]|nr:hypothetical protein [Ignavibacteria bacterium]